MNWLWVFRVESRVQSRAQLCCELQFVTWSNTSRKLEGQQHCPQRLQPLHTVLSAAKHLMQPRLSRFPVYMPALGVCIRVWTPAQASSWAAAMAVHVYFTGMMNWSWKSNMGSLSQRAVFTVPWAVSTTTVLCSEGMVPMNELERDDTTSYRPHNSNVCC